MHIHIYKYAYMHISIYINTYKYTYIWIYINTYAYTYVYTNTEKTHEYIHIIFIPIYV